MQRHIRNPNLYHQRAVAQPLATHFKRVTGIVADCTHSILGWITTIDESSEFGKQQAGYIRYKSGRRFIETKVGDGLTQFSFNPGQVCFHTHREQNGSAPLFYKVRKDGDKVYQESARFMHEMNEEVFQYQRRITGG